MAKPKRTHGQSSKRGWLNFISAVFLLLGFALLFAVALALVKIDLASQQSSRQWFLSSTGKLAFSYYFPTPTRSPAFDEIFQPTLDLPENNPPLPTSTPEQLAETNSQSTVTKSPQIPPSEAVDPQPTIEPEQTTPSPPEAVPLSVEQTGTTPDPEAELSAVTAENSQGEESPDGPSEVYLPITSRSDPSQSGDEPVVNIPNDDRMSDPPPGAFVGPSAGAVTHLVIPSIKVDRAVVMVGLKIGSGKQLTWNTDVLFSTANRQDLVGQTITSANPGDGGNIILIGHNYNNGWSANGAVFVNLLSLKPGSEITVTTESGREFRYIVQLVKKVPWKEQSDAELQKHHKYMWPTDHEQLTLVTCGGINLGLWSHRVYVIALPVENQIP